MHPAPSFAMLQRGDLRLVLSAPGGGPGGGQAMPDGTVAEPGGWNRFSLEVAELDSLVAALRASGAHFRNDIVDGVGGRQILLDDPPGNPVELFAVVMEAYVHGVSTRMVDDLVGALGVASGISKSEVSRICGEFDRDLGAFRDRPLDHASSPTCSPTPPTSRAASAGRVVVG